MRVFSARKGISPLATAILLIAITMTVAGLIAYWAVSFVNRTEEENTEDLCRTAGFKIYSCTYLSDSQKLNLILENQGDIELRDLNVFLIFEDATLSEAMSLDQPLSVDALRSYSLSEIPEFSKILVKTHCSGVTDEKTCR